MRKLAAAILVLVLSGMGSKAAAGAPRPADQPRTVEEAIDRVIVNENHLNQEIRKFSPLVETYIQNLKQDKDLGFTPAGDKYFLGRADFSKGVNLVSLTDADTKGKKLFSGIGNFFSFAMQYLPDGFLQMIFIDTNGFDKQHYKFDYVRREFLGEVRCLVFDVSPQAKAGKGRFLGRIWVEDQDYHIVRFNGAYGGSGRTSWYFHFDSWRTNAQPGLWLPSFIYSEEKDLHYALTKKLDFKAQTRLWGYNIGHAGLEQELSKILVESPVQDDSKTANDLTPVQAQRSWDRQAEENVADRLQRIGLMAPPGEVDKVLDTVVNNLEVTNNLDIDPEVRCRVLMTTTLESFTLGHTIVLSRGLIDVLPNEASLAAVIAHELGHVVLGHRMDTTYAFFDQLLVDDKETFRHFGFARTGEEEQAASAKAVELLNNSPYKDQLGSAALFLSALQARQKEIPNLIAAHLGDKVVTIADIKTGAAPAAPAAATTPNADPKKTPQAIAALPIGGRVKLDVWFDRLELIKSKPVGTVAEREKMPFEVTPFMPYLTRYGSDASKPAANASSTETKPPETASIPASEPKPADPTKP
ncbi:MAG TPA: M48 family metalloprotease [Candidatus Saccharimonadales bacterium]|nr:M48 family metalloprotease [Candidatus Saccharimonadales bacterium]